MGLFRFTKENLLHPPQELVRFVERMVEDPCPYEGHDRRAEPRYTLVRPILAMPIDDQLRPAGEGFKAVTRDISARGISICHTEPVEAKWLALELTAANGETMQAMLEVLRCRPLGPGYEIAGTFVTKIYERTLHDVASRPRPSHLAPHSAASASE